MLATCLFVILIAVTIGFLYKADAHLEIDFLDVGQGDSILIKAPSGQNILIDGGPDKTVLRRLSENLPWWDRQIDLIILTHPHDDHVGGLIEVLKHYQVKRIVYSGVIHSSPAYINWLEQIKNKEIPLTIIDRPQNINFSADCKLQFIYPRKNLAGQSVANLNNSSVITKLIYKKASALLVGDAEQEVENEMIDQKVNLSAQLLKVGHHGSDTASGEEFLNSVKPEIGIIQVGVDNSFGHPSKRILKKLERANVRVLRNDLDGTIKMISEGEKWQTIP
ncbi:MAG: Competence protein ComEA helix-hairpin-helix repeat protein [Parcubacteria group bacterium GW2011_GWE2_38_18]|nr:MAG: Competence protein ComEA helix-hairpin-helix repeat protein [Parcubacteria group bacterium GW2011_GWE2_38_18]